MYQTARLAQRRLAVVLDPAVPAQKRGRQAERQAQLERETMDARRQYCGGGSAAAVVTRRRVAIGIDGRRVLIGRVLLLVASRRAAVRRGARFAVHLRVLRSAAAIVVDGHRGVGAACGRCG